MSDLALQTRRLPGPGPVLATQVRYQLTLLMRNPRAIAAGLILPGALLALQLGGKQQHAGATAAGMANLAPEVAGLVVLSAAAIALFSHANGLVVAREEGVLRRWRASPLPAWAYFAGRIVATMLVTVAAGLILVMVAKGMADLTLTGHAITGLLAADALGALALAAAGTVITALIPSAQSAQPVLMLTYIPLILLSGSFGAIQSLPHWLTTAVTYLPAQPVINATSNALVHSGGPVMSLHDVAVLADWIAGGLLLSLWFFQWDPHRPAHARHAEARTTDRSA